MCRLIPAWLLCSLLLVSLVVVGCAAPAPKAPSLPALADIPRVTQYADDQRSWDTSAVCWVGMAADAKWNWNLPATAFAEIEWVRINTPQTVQQLIREELKNEGYEVKVYDNDYLTRDKRLAIQKLILFQDFDIRKTLVKEGACFDMKLTVAVVSNAEQVQHTLCEVWGRSLLSNAETKAWVDIIKDCVSNMRNVAEFRQALQPDI